jgi:hypothetical protein
MPLKAFGLKTDGRGDGVAAEIGGKPIAGAFRDGGSVTIWRLWHYLEALALSKENQCSSGSWEGPPFTLAESALTKRSNPIRGHAHSNLNAVIGPA